MATIANSARIVLKGFDTEGIDETSPLEDQVALTYRAAYHYADVNNFKPHIHRGVSGRAGPMVMKRITDILFPIADTGVRDKINGLVTQVLKKTDAAVCIQHPMKRDEMPVWFVANKMPSNLTIVALSHTGRDVKTSIREPMLPTRGEMKLTTEEAGENLPPGEVTVRHGEPKRREPIINPSGGHVVPEQVLEAFEAQHERRRRQHLDNVEVVFKLIEQHGTVSAVDVTEMMAAAGGTTTESSAVRNILGELEEAGRIVKRLEVESERLVRGGGALPRGKRVHLYGVAPGPVPERTSLPEGGRVYRPAMEWEKERVAELDALCDKVIEVLSTNGPDRARSIGKVAAAAGLTEGDVRKAVDRLIKLDLVYERNYNYYLTERRRDEGSRVIPPYANGDRDQEAAKEAATASQEPLAASPPQEPGGLEAMAAQAVYLIDEMVKAASESSEAIKLRERVAELEATVAKQAKVIASLRGAIATMEE